MNPILTSLRTKYNTFSKTQKKIANFILENPENITLLSITELAKNCDTSETTVMRLLKKLDYDSYQVFRIHLAKELSEQPRLTLNEDLNEQDDLETIKQKILSHTITSIQDINVSLTSKHIEQAIHYLSTCKRLLVFGVGASAAISLDAFHKFSNIGLNVCSYPDPHMMNIICSHATSDDLFLAISHTGESNEVLNSVRLAKKKGVKIISLTSFANSTLAQLSDLFLLSSTNEKKYHSEAMASRIVQLTIVDILYIATFMQNEANYYNALTQSRIAVSYNKT